MKRVHVHDAYSGIGRFGTTLRHQEFIWLEPDRVFA